MMGLMDFFKKIPTMNELTGSFGEQLAKIYLKTVPGALVLHDVLIDGAEGHTSQIDLLIIGGKGIYVVEVKMYADAKIYGDTKKSEWYYYNHGKKYEIYSPLKQNQKHVEYLKNFLQEFQDVPYYSIVAMICDDFKISGDYPPDTALCNSLPMLKQAMLKLSKDKPVIWNEEKKKEIFNYIQTHQQQGRDARQMHKENVISYQDGRREMQQQKICPFCKTDLVLRKGKYGDFYGCVNYPRCRYIFK